MWPFKKTKLEVKVIHRDSLNLRLAEWQADEKLSHAAAKLLLDPTFQLMLQVNRNESPHLMHLTVDCALDARALHQARIEGYNMCLRNFQAMAEHRPIASTIEPTFEQEESNDK
jgi:hypothetical protein